MSKKAKPGFRGYPVGTVAFYGPDDQRASKVAVCIFTTENSDLMAMQRWFSENTDLRSDARILSEVMGFLKDHAVKSVTMADGIFGCPHEEGIDYEGKVCPHCPFWANRDRFTQSRARILAEVARQKDEGELP